MLSINVLTALYTVIEFVPVPYGTYVRPLGWVVMIFLIAAVSFCLGALLAVSDAMDGRTKSAISCALLSLTPCPLAIFVFKIFVAIKGLHPED